MCYPWWVLWAIRPLAFTAHKDNEKFNMFILNMQSIKHTTLHDTKTFFHCLYFHVTISEKKQISHVLIIFNKGFHILLKTSFKQACVLTQMLFGMFSESLFFTYWGINIRILVSLFHENGGARQTCLYPSLTTIPESCSTRRCWCQMELSFILVVPFFTLPAVSVSCCY